MRWHAQTLPWWSQALNMQELNVTEIKDEFSCHWCWGLRCRAGGRSCIETGSNSPVIWEIQFLKKRNTVTESEKYKWWWGADMQSRRQAMYRGSDPPVTSSSAPFRPTGQRTQPAVHCILAPLGNATCSAMYSCPNALLVKAHWRCPI